MHTSRLFFIVLFMCVIGSTASTAQAQFLDGLSFTEPITLQQSPQHPAPNQQVTVTLNDYSSNTSGARTQWFVDGVEVVRAQNERAIVLGAGELGYRKNVLVVMTLPAGIQFQAKTTITPIRVDMLIEADTLAPSFYKGRTIPSTGSFVQVTAIPFTGEARTPESFSYTWRVDDTVQTGGSRLGKNAITFSSGFSKNSTVSVDVLDTDGSLITTKSISIPLTDPELYFYEVNPLRGMSEAAITNDFIFIGDEIKVRAEPYFIDATLLNQNPHIEWKLNGTSIINPNGNLQEITLRKQGGTGSFNLEFHIRNLRQLLQGVKDSVTINF